MVECTPIGGTVRLPRETSAGPPYERIAVRIRREGARRRHAAAGGNVGLIHKPRPIPRTARPTTPRTPTNYQSRCVGAMLRILCAGLMAYPDRCGPVSSTPSRLVSFDHHPPHPFISMHSRAALNGAKKKHCSLATAFLAVSLGAHPCVHGLRRSPGIPCRLVAGCGKLPRACRFPVPLAPTRARRQPAGDLGRPLCSTAVTAASLEWPPLAGVALSTIQPPLEPATRRPRGRTPRATVAASPRCGRNLVQASDQAQQVDAVRPKHSKARRRTQRIPHTVHTHPRLVSTYNLGTVLTSSLLPYG